MNKMKRILYAQSDMKMNAHYSEFKQNYHHIYPLLQKHFEILWEQRCFQVLFFCSELLIYGNNTNNYVECSFGLLKDIIFARTQAFNLVQVFHFVTENMERYYKRRLLGIAHNHPGHVEISKRFLCLSWEMVNRNSIQATAIKNEYLVPSTKKESGLFYIVNSAIEVCSCPVEMTGVPCKQLR